LYFSFPGNDSFFAGFQKLEEQPRLALGTAELFLCMLFVARVAGLALCYGENNNLTRLCLLMQFHSPQTQAAADYSRSRTPSRACLFRLEEAPSLSRGFVQRGQIQVFHVAVTVLHTPQLFATAL
jgi:hypothetical protein